jgi:hypothetical protein
MDAGRPASKGASMAILKMILVKWPEWSLANTSDYGYQKEPQYVLYPVEEDCYYQEPFYTAHTVYRKSGQAVLAERLIEETQTKKVEIDTDTFEVTIIP